MLPRKKRQPFHLAEPMPGDAGAKPLTDMLLSQLLQNIHSDVNKGLPSNGGTLDTF